MNINSIFFLLFLFLLNNNSMDAQDTLIHNKALWIYLDDGTYLGNDWTEQHYPSLHWKEGYSPLGFDTKNGLGKLTISWIKYVCNK